MRVTQRVRVKVIFLYGLASTLSAHFYLCRFLSVALSVAFSLSRSVSFSVYLCLYPCMSMSAPVLVLVSVSFCLCLSDFLSVDSDGLSLSLSVSSVSLSLNLYSASTCLYLFWCLSLQFFSILSQCLPLCISPFFSTSFCLCVLSSVRLFIPQLYM